MPTGVALGAGVTSATAMPLGVLLTQEGEGGRVLAMKDAPELVRTACLFKKDNYSHNCVVFPRRARV